MNYKVTDEYGHRKLAFDFYTEEEILVRIYTELKHIPPLSGYRSKITIDSDNATEPPYITVSIYDKDGDGVNDYILNEIIDQNTYYDVYIDILKLIVQSIRIAVLSEEKSIPYKEAQDLYFEIEQERTANLPF